MKESEAKEILRKLMIRVVDNGHATIALGSHESAALRVLIYPAKK